MSESSEAFVVYPTPLQDGSRKTEFSHPETISSQSPESSTSNLSEESSELFQLKDSQQKLPSEKAVPPSTGALKTPPDTQLDFHF